MADPYGLRPMWLRRLLLRLALGRQRYIYMTNSVLSDPRTPRARSVDVVVRRDGVERRIEADWIKFIARLLEPTVPAKKWEEPNPDEVIMSLNSDLSRE